MGVMFDNVDLRGDACWWKGGTGTMTVPVDSPGDLVSLGFSTQFRRSPKDRIRVTASSDNGQSSPRLGWSSAGPTQADEHTRVDKWPSKIRKVLLRPRDDWRQHRGRSKLSHRRHYRDPIAATTVPPVR